MCVWIWYDAKIRERTLFASYTYGDIGLWRGEIVQKLLLLFTCVSLEPLPMYHVVLVSLY